MVTDNLALQDDLPLSDEAWAWARREAGIRLAGIALAITGRDEEAAAAMLRGPLEAIGALPYEAQPGHWRWGGAAS